MAAAIDPAELLGQVKSVLSAKLGKDVSQLEGFAEQQLSAIAQQAATIGLGVADGSIAGDTQTFLLKELAESLRSFVNTLAGLAVVSAEELWNAAVDVVWGAINKATGLALTPP
jgi:hypothetical protein